MLLNEGALESTMCGMFWLISGGAWVFLRVGLLYGRQSYYAPDGSRTISRFL